MRTNGWQLTAIIAIILVVVLGVVLVIMGRNHTDLASKATEAEKAAADAKNTIRQLDGEVASLKSMIGKESVPTKEIEALHAEDMNKCVPGDNAASRTYHDAIISLLGDLETERESHKGSQESLTQLETDYGNVKRLYDTVVGDTKKQLEQARQEIDQKDADFQKRLKVNEQKMNANRNTLEKGMTEAEEKAKTAEQRAEKYAEDNDKIRSTNKTLIDQLDHLRRTEFDRPLGKILSVNQQAGIALVNLGSEDGLQVRTMFSVYHSSITGISFSAGIPGSEPVVCDVCKRERSLNASKASVEVVRILGPHKSEVRILDDILSDPLVSGEVVYTPIWKPGQKQRFALTANMKLPGSGGGEIASAEDLEIMRRLIESNGGIVDSYIDEQAKSQVGTISSETTYIVVNEAMESETEADINKLQQKMLDDAALYAVRKISLTDLLSRMGWKNVTPIQGFGKLSSGSRIAPADSPRASRGVVSPLFNPPDNKTRIDPGDMPARPSAGRVADFYSGKPPAAKQSSGQTSDLFRPRKPVAGEGE
jgi:hypothetical protein